MGGKYYTQPTINNADKCMKQFILNTLFMYYKPSVSQFNSDAPKNKKAYLCSFLGEATRIAEIIYARIGYKNGRIIS